MADMHITRELLDAIALGEIPVRVLEDLILEHLKKVCPHCRRELEEFAKEQETERKGTSPGPGFEAVSAVLDRHLRDLQRGHDRARRDVEKLPTFPREERTAWIRRSRTRYRGRQIVWIILLGKPHGGDRLSGGGRASGGARPSGRPVLARRAGGAWACWPWPLRT